MVWTVLDLRLNQTQLKVMSKPFEKWTLPTTLSIVWVRMAVSKTTEPLALSYQLLQGHLYAFAVQGFSKIAILTFYNDRLCKKLFVYSQH